MSQREREREEKREKEKRRESKKMREKRQEREEGGREKERRKTLLQIDISWQYALVPGVLARDVKVSTAPATILTVID